MRLSHLSATEARAYAIADNRLADLAGWNREILATELQGLIDLDFEVELTGFTAGQIELILGDADEVQRETENPEDAVPQPLPGPTICQGGDLWVLGRHRLLYRGARNGDTYDLLLEGDAGYADTAIRQWQAHSGKPATLATTGQTFEEVEGARLGTRPIENDQQGAATLEETR